MGRRKLALVFLFFFLAFVFPADSTADMFKAVRSYSGLDDLSRTEEDRDVDIDLAGIVTDRDMATKVSKDVFSEIELGDSGTERPEVVLRLNGIRKENGKWYLGYNWAYASDYKDGDFKRFRLFNAKIDLKNRKVVYELSQEHQWEW